MKRNSKNVNNKQNLISSFFPKISKNNCKETEIQQTTPISKPSTSNEVNHVDSDEDFVESTPNAFEKQTKSKVENKKRKSFISHNIFTKKQKRSNEELNITSVNNKPKKMINDKTPTKSPRKSLGTPKKTPKKLFSKSPNVNEFKVDILEKFVVITPSKSNEKYVIKTPSKSSEKKQKSLLNYVNSSGSKKSWEVQNENEKTPTTKMSNASSTLISSSSKVKVKLDFSGSRSPLKALNLENGESIVNTEGAFVEKLNDEIKENSINFDDSWDDQFEINEDQYLLDLSVNNYCKVLNIESAKNALLLIIESIENKEKAKCVLKDFWINCKLTIGCKIYIEAKKIDNDWIVSNHDGLIVFEPDFLISCTALVKSLFCKRQMIFEQYYGYESGNKYMVVGSLVHTLLQEVLKAKISTIKGIESIVKRLLKRKNTLHMLYSASIDLKYVENEMALYVPKVLEFVTTYVKTNHNAEKLKKTQKNLKDNWKGQIDTIEDIEDNLWCKQLGLKGKIDVTIKSNRDVMPLELKTGKSTMSLEHRAQIILYIMMMNKLGYEVNSGLLLYLKDGVLRNFPVDQKAKRDLLLLRNECAYYLTKTVKILKENDISLKVLPPELPEPIDRPSACKKCSCNIVCSAYLKNEDVHVPNGLKDVSRDVLSHLKSSHIDYFNHWISLIHLESSDDKSSKNVNEIYTISPSEREKKLKCLPNMILTEVNTETHGLYKHVFKKDEAKMNLFGSSICQNNYVVISTDKRPAIASGIVQDKDATTIIVALDRDLSVKYSKEKFHLDTYDSKNADNFNMTNLSILMEPNEKANKLRKLIIDKEEPTFNRNLPTTIVVKCAAILKNLNRSQRSAVLKVLMANDYLLIKGMPGTGKTATIVALIQCLLKLDKTVLVTSHTHSAVDNVCVRLIQEGVDILRLGSRNRIHDDLAKFSESSLTENCKSVEDLEMVYNKAKVVAVTCLGSSHSMLLKRTFDYCIVDESTQVLQPSILRTLTTANVFILIGDPDQLEPVVRNYDATNLGFSESLFERLCTPLSCVSLIYNYRMNKVITQCANELTYKGELLIGTDLIASSTLKLSVTQELESTFESQPWIKQALDVELERAVCLIDTGSVWNLQKSNNVWIDDMETYRCTNIYEMAVIEKLVGALLQGAVSCKRIGIMSPYRAQVTKLSDLLKENNDLEVSTVDQFQGRDKDVIIYSCTRSNDSSKSRQNTKNDILENKRRLTVAITRAKLKLILVGDLATIKTYTPFSELLKSIKSTNIINIEDADSGFNWNVIN